MVVLYSHNIFAKGKLLPKQSLNPLSARNQTVKRPNIINQSLDWAIYKRFKPNSERHFGISTFVLAH